MNSLPIETLRARLRYDSECGCVYWIASDQVAACWNATFAGKRAMSACNKDGYLCGMINGVKFTAHRVAWALHHGVWPVDFIDHINHDRTDNRICNLRVVSRIGNQRNLKKRADNTSGVTGVGWCSRLNKWRATAYLNRKHINLGFYELMEDAVAARRRFNELHDYHPNHGQPAQAAEVAI